MVIKTKTPKPPTVITRRICVALLGALALKLLVPEVLGLCIRAIMGTQCHSMSSENIILCHNERHTPPTPVPKPSNQLGTHRRPGSHRGRDPTSSRDPSAPVESANRNVCWKPCEFGADSAARSIATRGAVYRARAQRTQTPCGFCLKLLRNGPGPPGCRTSSQNILTPV